MSNPTIIRVPGEPGPRGPRGFPFLIKGTLSDPSELSGSYLEFDGENEVIFEGLQPGDIGYEEPVIASAYLIGENIWVFDDQELWINSGAIRPTITIDEVNVINPDQSPDVRNTGTQADGIFEFDLPRAPSFSIGQVLVGDNAQDFEVVDVGQDGDVELNIKLPRSTVGVGDTNTLTPNESPSVSDVGGEENVELEFNIPRAREVSVGEVNSVAPDQNPSVSASELSTGDVELDFSLPRAPAFSLEPTNVLTPDQDPSVAITDSTDGDVELAFDLPRAPVFSVGTVTTLEDTEPAAVTNVGANGDIELNFEIPAGKVGIQFRGDWSSSESYEIRDVVTFRDASDDTESAYISIASSTNQQPPALENSPSAFWTVLASGGSDGAGAPSTATPLEVTAAVQEGAIGVLEQFARADHAHPSQGFLPEDAEIKDLSNVSAPSPDDGSVLVFDGEDSQWVAAVPDPIVLNEIDDVNAASPITGQILLYDGDNWTGSFIDGGGPSSVYI